MLEAMKMQNSLLSTKTSKVLLAFFVINLLFLYKPLALVRVRRLPSRTTIACACELGPDGVRARSSIYNLRVQ